MSTRGPARTEAVRLPKARTNRSLSSPLPLTQTHTLKHMHTLATHTHAHIRAGAGGIPGSPIRLPRSLGALAGSSSSPSLLPSSSSGPVPTGPHTALQEVDVAWNRLGPAAAVVFHALATNASVTVRGGCWGGEGVLGEPKPLSFPPAPRAGQAQCAREHPSLGCTPALRCCCFR